jgi:protein-L-isoaspartate(D-aspartate) O-methyltransferase
MRSTSCGGRLILPLTTNQGFHGSAAIPIEQRGAVFRIERRGGEFLAKWISPVAILPCEGAGDAESEARWSWCLRKRAIGCG